jgi:hypothetical protein
VANIEQKSKMKKLIKTSPEMAYSDRFHKTGLSQDASVSLYTLFIKIHQIKSCK